MTPNALRAAEILLDAIGKTETGRTGAEAYNTIYGHRETKLTKPVTEFTLDELLSAQKTWGKNWGSSAAGKFQIIRKTLLGLVGQLGLNGATTKFSFKTQDMLGYQLLKGRGFEQFVAGSLPLKAFALNLAKEWASFPVLGPTQGGSRAVERGQSFYAGDGLNKALVGAGEVEALLAEVLNEATRTKPADVAPTPLPRSTPKPEPQTPAPLPRTGKGWGFTGWAIVIAVVLAAAVYLIGFARF